jgi:hypothetical protein
MTNLASKLALAAALAAAVPAVTLACDDDRGAPVAVYPAQLPAPAPVYTPAYAPGPGYQYEAAPAYGPAYRHDGWRWRAQERARLRAEYARLDRIRDDFYARPGLRRGQARRFEAWYADRRAELDQQWGALSGYAAR